MYREFRVSSSAPRVSETHSFRNWQKDKADDAVDQTGPARIIVNNITTNPGVEVYRVRQDSKPEGEISTRAIIGTLLGASAGAAVAYAMAKGENGKPVEVGPYRVEHRTIEAPAHQNPDVIYDPPKSLHSRVRGIELTDRETDDLGSKHSGSASRIQTLPSQPPQYGNEARSVSGSHTGRTIAQTHGTKILTGQTGLHSGASRRSQAKSIREEPDCVQPPISSHSSAHRSAKDVPLPPSALSTNLTPATNRRNPLNDLATVVPDDSISQVSTKGSSRTHGRSKHHNDHHHHSKSGHGSKHGRRNSHGSSRTVKASDRYSSHTGSHRR